MDGPAEARTSRLIQESTWTYRSDGAPKSITDTDSGGRSFTLDALGRVTAVTATNWSEHYAYDAVGNITHAADTRTPDAATAGRGGGFFACPNLLVVPKVTRRLIQSAVSVMAAREFADISFGKSDHPEGTAPGQL